MNKTETKEKLLKLFQLCCEKRPHEMKFGNLISLKPEDSAVTKASEYNDKSRKSFYEEARKLVEKAMNLMPKGVKYGSKTNTELPFKLHVNYRRFDYAGYEFSEQPPIIRFTGTAYVEIELLPTITIQKRRFRKDKEIVYNDEENFTKVKDFLQEKVSELKDLGVTYRVKTFFPQTIVITKTFYYLSFGELCVEISHAECENLKNIREEAKEKVSCEKLNKRIDEMEQS